VNEIKGVSLEVLDGINVRLGAESIWALQQAPTLVHVPQIFLKRIQVLALTQIRTVTQIELNY
jgi:hypothetical protein